jgi:hypothetical protein
MNRVEVSGKQLSSVSKGSTFGFLSCAIILCSLLCYVHSFRDEMLDDKGDVGPSWRSALENYHTRTRATLPVTANLGVIYAEK